MASPEQELWNRHEEKVKDILYYFFGFFQMQAEDNPIGYLTQCCIDNVCCTVRLVSWVESKHGTEGVTQPERDPMQSGNPDNRWWKEMTGQLGPGKGTSRFISGPGKENNYYAPELCELFIIDIEKRVKAYERRRMDLFRYQTQFPDTYFEMIRWCDRQVEWYSHLAEKLHWTCSDDAMSEGHKNESFEPCMSYFWGILYLLHKIRLQQFYKINGSKIDKLLVKAADYNDGHDPKYLDKLKDARGFIECGEDC